MLLKAWEDVGTAGNGPRVVTIVGEPGYGKTRIVKEFYKQIAAKQSYWPAGLPQNGNRMDINPHFGSGLTKPEIPWLWWGIRCESTETRNGTQDEGCALIRSSAHLIQHTGALERKRVRAKKIGRLKAAGLAQLLKVAEEIPVLGTVIRYYSSGREWLELYSSAVEAAKPVATPSPGVKMQVDVQNACEACVTICQTFIDPTDGDLSTVPMVLVIDDAHAADSLTIKCVYQILHFAYSRKLPLLVVATHWAKEWNSSHWGPPPNFTMADSWKSFRQISSALPLRPGTAAESVFYELECDGVDCGLILGHLKLGLGERLEQHCVEFSDGNPQMLHELLSFLYESRKHHLKGWWFKNPAPDLRLSEGGFDEFAKSTKSKEEFLKHRAEEVQKDPHLSILLQLGALQGHNFLGRFTAEVWRDFEDALHARPAPLALLRSAENPHHVIRLSNSEGDFAKFRHRSYREAFLSMDPAKRQTLIDAISVKAASWLESTPDDSANTDFFQFAVDWFREKKDNVHLEPALGIRAKHLLQFGRPAHAVELLSERLELLVQRHGRNSPEANIAGMRLAEGLAEAARFQESIQILKPLRKQFGSQEELWIDCSRSLSRALLKQSDLDGVPQQSFVNWISGKRWTTPERDLATEILREVWSYLQRKRDSNSLDVLLAGIEYGNAITEGGCDRGLQADQGLIILPCCAKLLDDFSQVDAAKDIALMALGKYLNAWRWPQETRTSRRLDTSNIAAFYEQNKRRVIALRQHYPEAEKVFCDLIRHRSTLLGKMHPATFEARRLELQSWITWPKSIAPQAGDKSSGGIDIRTKNFRKLVADAKSALGDHHPQTLECEVALAACLQGSESTRFEAATITRSVFQRSRLHLGADHPYTVTVEKQSRALIPNS